MHHPQMTEPEREAFEASVETSDARATPSAEGTWRLVGGTPAAVDVTDRLLTAPADLAGLNRGRHPDARAPPPAPPPRRFKSYPIAERIEP